MAAPSEVTLQDLNGYWVMNKSLSDPLDSMLALQGTNWLLRKLIPLAKVTMRVTESIDGNGTTHIRMDHTATGGIKAETEFRKLDWSLVPHVSGVFGETSCRSRWMKVDGSGAMAESGAGGPLHPWLMEGWLVEADINGEGKVFIQNWVVNEKMGWTAEQVWGFAMLDGKRYQVRKFLVRKGGEEARVRMVYEWKGRTKAD